MNALQQSIQALLKNADIQELKKSSSSITAHYRENRSLTSKQELLAYLVARMPATYAVICKILSTLPQSGSLLDMGAGPGTVWWAANALWKQTLVTAIERETAFIEIGKKLGAVANWIQGDLTAFKKFETHDWVIFSYSLTELPPSSYCSLLTKCWDAANHGVILIEPGTPLGYQNILKARQILIDLGGFVSAPCPHSKPCPMKSPDWCHFSVRLERSFLHRNAKQATLGYEDEKFSYVIVTKEQPQQTFSRIIRPPLRRSGHVVLSLCTPEGLTNTTFSAKQKKLYKKARKSSWGEEI